MSPHLAQLSEQIRALPDEDKAVLVDEILEQLDRPDPAVHAAWQQEVARRIEAAKDGSMGSVDFDEEIKKYL